MSTRSYPCRFYKNNNSDSSREQLLPQLLLRLQSCRELRARLSDLVTKHMCKVFTEHRKALKNNLGYSDTGSGPAGIDVLQQETDCFVCGYCDMVNP